MSTDERWERWGAHYLRALYRAHQYQMRTNFMDPGVQPYGGSFFDGLVERGGTIFKRLPMNKTPPLDAHSAANSLLPPNLMGMIDQRQQQQAQQQNQLLQQLQQRALQPAPPRAPDPAPVDNEDYYGGSGGGCFGGSCTVVTEGGAEKRVRDVRRGDRLKLASGDFAVVDVVVELRAPRRDMVVLEQHQHLLITPNHPLRISSGASWTQPKKLVAADAPRGAVDAVFNFVFTKRPACGLEVNGVECVTYMHAVPEMQHGFYTSEAGVLRALQAEWAGYDAGYVVVNRRTLKKQ
jgi:hypothetical protein